MASVVAHGERTLETLFHGFRLHRLLSLPRRPAQRWGGDPYAKPEEGRRSDGRIFAALAAAHASLAHAASGPPPALAVAWVRTEPLGPLHFIVGGRPFFPPAADRADRADGRSGVSHRVAFPPGAFAAPFAEGEFEEALGALPYWVRCAGAPDPFWYRSNRNPPEAGPRPVLDDAAACLEEPFAWVVVATPVDRLVLDMFGDEPAELPVVLAEDHARFERDAARRRELARARATGMWDIRVLAGAGDTAGAHAAAALLCGADDLADRPFTLTPTRGVTDLARAWTAPPSAGVSAVSAAADPGGGGGWPFVAPTEYLAALARPPVREVPGLRMTPPNTFGTSAPEPAENGVVLGRILDEDGTAVGDLAVSRATLNRHAFVCGATGSGKSQTVRSLLTTLSTAPDPVPWLVLEPAKAEYARMAGRLGPGHRVTVIRPGDLDTAPASLNPLEPEPGYPLQSHIDLIRALFMAAFTGHEPFPQVLARALNECYTKAGWDLVTGEPRPAHKPKYTPDDPNEARTAHHPTLGDLQETAKEVVDKIGYGKEVTADVKGFVDIRIGSLREGSAGRFFEGGHPLDIADLLAGNVVIELETLTNDQEQAFFIGTLLIRITEHLRLHHAAGAVPLRHLLVVEEAHRLLRNKTHGLSNMSVELFASLLAEIRAYGEGVVIVEQIPGKIIPDVVKNSALKIMHRLPAEDDRRAVGAAMNLDPAQSDSVVALEPGYAAVATDGMDKPVLVHVPHHEHTENAAEASTRAPLRGRRSPLCGAACRWTPCTLRAMNESRHRSLEPLHLIWVEAAATAVAMGMPAPAPAEPVRTPLTALDRRDLECTLAYAAEKAVAAREPLMRDDVDPGDFATRLHATLSAALLGTAAPTEDPRRFTYANYRFRDVLEAIAAARKAAPDGPHTYPPEQIAEWARRGLSLTGSSGADHRLQVRATRGYAPDRAHARVGDVVRSGLLDAVLAVTGGTAQEHVTRALRQACAPGRPVEVVIVEAAQRMSLEFARFRPTPK